MAKQLQIRLADAITHFLLALIILVHVDTAELPLLRTVAVGFSMVLAPIAAAIILYHLYQFTKLVVNFISTP